MTARFCIDCNHDRTPGAEEKDLVSFTPGSGWIAEFGLQVPEGQELDGLTEMRGKDGSRWGTWTAEVIGWAVMERHYLIGGGCMGHEREVEPVLLDEDSNLLPLSEYRDNHTDTHYHLTRRPAGQPVRSAA